MPRPHRPSPSDSPDAPDASATPALTEGGPHGRRVHRPRLRSFAVPVLVATPLLIAVLAGQSVAANRQGRVPSNVQRPTKSAPVALEGAPDRPDVVAKASAPRSRRARAVRIDERLLDSGAPTVDLRAFDDVHSTATLDHIERRRDGDYTWYGRTEGSAKANVMLTVVDGAVAGSIDLPDQTIAIQPAGPDVEVAQEVASDDLNAETDKHVIPPDGEHDHADHDHGGPAAPEAPAGGNDAFTAAAPTAALAPVEIDVLVVYQQVIVTRAGGSGNAAASVQAAIDRTNQSFINSRINVRMRLVRQQQVADAEIADLDRIRTSSTVANLRNQYGADLVQGWGTYSGFCGVAYQNMNRSSSAYGFSLVDANCTSGLTVPHEWGHNLGAGHDRANQTSAAFSYSFGWVSIPGDFRTIMTYENRSCPGGSCARVQYFSNPNLTLNGYPLGKANSEDNARTINNVGSMIAAYRTPAVGSRPTVTSVVERSGPAAGGRRVTLRGTGFNGTTGITVGWARVTNYTVVNDTTITLTTPPNFKGWAAFRVTKPAGTSASTLSSWYRYV